MDDANRPDEAKLEEIGLMTWLIRAEKDYLRLSRLLGETDEEIRERFTALWTTAPMPQYSAKDRASFVGNMLRAIDEVLAEPRPKTLKELDAIRRDSDIWTRIYCGEIAANAIKKAREERVEIEKVSEMMERRRRGEISDEDLQRYNRGEISLDDLL